MRSLLRVLRRKHKPAAEGCTPLPLEDGGGTYAMPPEEAPHEGTWLQWPHDHGYDRRHVERYERTWVQMATELHVGEMVHVVAYDGKERDRIAALLREEEGLDMTKIDVVIGRTDDVWIRDNGPIFVRDSDGRLVVEDWKFNGWGRKADFSLCNEIPRLVCESTGLPRISIPMVNEGGSVDLDGRGTLMAKRSSILNRNRNPGWRQCDAEAYFRRYLQATNFVWLDGVKGGDITDDHIDGTARFANGNTIVTHSPSDSDPKEYKILENARDTEGRPYTIVHLPLTDKKLPKLRDYGTYVNYYVANEVVLAPRYGDKNDSAACEVIQSLYPSRRVVGIDAAELAKDGGMVHCVTQQQPL